MPALLIVTHEEGGVAPFERRLRLLVDRSLRSHIGQQHLLLPAWIGVETRLAARRVADQGRLGPAPRAERHRLFEPAAVPVAHPGLLEEAVAARLQRLDHGIVACDHVEERRIAERFDDRGGIEFLVSTEEFVHPAVHLGEIVGESARSRRLEQQGEPLLRRGLLGARHLLEHLGEPLGRLAAVGRIGDRMPLRRRQIPEKRQALWQLQPGGRLGQPVQGIRGAGVVALAEARLAALQTVGHALLSRSRGEREAGQ